MTRHSTTIKDKPNKPQCDRTEVDWRIARDGRPYRVRKVDGDGDEWRHPAERAASRCEPGF